MSIDMSKFHQAFYEESFEALEIVESSLLGIDPNAPDSEVVNTIFRLIHSIKGGSKTFGFSQVGDFAHSMEDLLDRAREDNSLLTKELVDLLLKSSDFIKELLEVSKTSGSINLEKFDELLGQLKSHLGEEHTATNANEENNETNESEDNIALEAEQEVAQESADEEQAMIEQQQEALANANIAIPEVNTGRLANTIKEKNSKEADTGTINNWTILFTPIKEFLRSGNEITRIFKELSTLGELEVEAKFDKVPYLEDLRAEELHIHWEIKLNGKVSEADIAEVFEWVDDLAEIIIREEDDYVPEDDNNLDSKVNEKVDEIDPKPVENKESDKKVITTNKAVQDNKNISPDKEVSQKEGSLANKTNVEDEDGKKEISETSKIESTEDEESLNTKSEEQSTSIRVSTEKIDKLVNLVGELVVTQSTLYELSKGATGEKAEKLKTAISILEKNNKEIQESVMGIRMLPISAVFGKFPRMIRELSDELGKKINLKLLGEGTELDKTVIEKIGDPLIHLIRNSADHGIETTEERKACGKSEEATITLNAYHKGGNIVIEVSDDGKGLNTKKILEKAVENGLASVGEKLTKAQIHELIFNPGFSTANEVSAVSGRGVGMDVVRRNIEDMHGDVEVASEEGKGTTFTIRLPLTMAIIDGQLVKVEDQIYIVPVVSICETVSVDKSLLTTVDSELEVYHLREEYIPITRLANIFNLTEKEKELTEGLLVIVEYENRKVALFVDDIITQQQVVIKNVDSNYLKVQGVSGAATLGDGTVALIIDITSFIKLAGINSKSWSKVEGIKGE